jgi:hypothetical protein
MASRVLHSLPFLLLQLDLVFPLRLLGGPMTFVKLSE